MREKINELYEAGQLEFNPCGTQDDFVNICVTCARLSPNPIYIEVDKFEYRNTGNDACIEKLLTILTEEDYVKLL